MKTFYTADVITNIRYGYDGIHSKNRSNNNGGADRMTPPWSDMLLLMLGAKRLPTFSKGRSVSNILRIRAMCAQIQIEIARS